MFTDFVVPKNNENKFFKKAQVLGYRKIIFCYNYNHNLSKKKINEKIKNTDTKIETGFAIIVEKPSDIHKARSITPNVIFISSKYDLRNVSERFKPKFISNLEFQKQDFIHHRASGINQITGKSFKKNKTSIIFSLNLLFSTKYKAEVLGRIKQNIKLSRKYGFDIKQFTFAKEPENMKSPKDLVSLLITLGATQKEAKNSVIF